MGFRLAPKSVTLNDLELAPKSVTLNDGHVVCVILPNSVALGPYCVKVVEDTGIHFVSEI